MTNNFKIALLQCPDVTFQIESFFSHIYQVNSAKDLVRLLIEKEVDLVIVSENFKDKEKLKKVFQSYLVPCLFLNQKYVPQKSKDFAFKIHEDGGNLFEEIENFSDVIYRFQTKRENKKMQFTLEGTTEFTMSVLHTTKDMFISETKKYFSTRFKLESCHWVEVKAASSKLPPILKLKQELEKQKVDQGALISVLDDCTSEIASEPGYQIWKTHEGHYLALMWIPLEENVSQCIILNKIQIKNRKNFESLLNALGPFLYRRWNLCMTVGEAQQQVYKDSLTNLYNQKFLNEILQKKIEEYKRYKTAFSILFIDVDHFKRVNDSLGHVIGSGVLKEMGNLLEEQIRHSDYAFRYGGDEFIVLLSHTEGEDAVNVAERIRNKVEKYNFDVNGICVNITVSIGLAFFPVHAENADDIIRIADEAMYCGKNKSRNIVYKAS